MARSQPIALPIVQPDDWLVQPDDWPIDASYSSSAGFNPASFARHFLGSPASDDWPIAEPSSYTSAPSSSFTRHLLGSNALSLFDREGELVRFSPHILIFSPHSPSVVTIPAVASTSATYTLFLSTLRPSTSSLSTVTPPVPNFICLSPLTQMTWSSISTSTTVLPLLLPLLPLHLQTLPFLPRSLHGLLPNTCPPITLLPPHCLLPPTQRPLPLPGLPPLPLRLPPLVASMFLRLSTSPSRLSIHILPSPRTIHPLFLVPRITLNL